jgi:hypothetical protein
VLALAGSIHRKLAAGLLPKGSSESIRRPVRVRPRASALRFGYVKLHGLELQPSRRTQTRISPVRPPRRSPSYGIRCGLNGTAGGLPQRIGIIYAQSAEAALAPPGDRSRLRTASRAVGWYVRTSPRDSAAGRFDRRQAGTREWLRTSPKGTAAQVELTLAFPMGGVNCENTISWGLFSTAQDMGL